MTEKTDLKYDDLISPTLSPKDYLKSYGDKISSNYKTYEPQLETLEKNKKFLREKGEKLKIVALGAEWCPDCSRNVPRMIKITESMESEDIDLQILYGVVVNALHKPGETIWHKKRSPPEAVDPKFALEAIPTFYFFDKNGQLIGVIVEAPKGSSTLEDELLEILEKKR